MATAALFVVESMVRGYHVYQENWNATVGEELVCRRETGNVLDAFAVAVIKSSEPVGHVPRKIFLHMLSLPSKRWLHSL